MADQSLLVLHGVVEAPVADVAAVLLDVGPGGRSPLRTDVPGVTVTASPEVPLVVVEGQWWYRGETALSEDPRGCLVTRRIVNVARRARWAVRFVARAPLASSRDEFGAALRALGAAVDRPAYLVES